MRAMSVGEYLVMFGALVAVIATAVISLGRLVVFQAGTAEERYAQSTADEISSMVNEVAALPDGSYYGFEPTRSQYNITITTTKIIVARTDKQTYATHLARSIVPVILDSREKMCVQKSLGKILVKNGDCLDCTPGDGFCDSGCDGVGRCDPDCIILGKRDSYCSRSCALVQDDLCDPDCNGKSDGIWDPDCGCLSLRQQMPCVEDGICDPDSGILDFSWDPDCLKEDEDGICDPDYIFGCDPDCGKDDVCRGTCKLYSEDDRCFPACNNTACSRCGTTCIHGCSRQPPGWRNPAGCRIVLKTTEDMDLSLLKVNLTMLAERCGEREVHKDSFQLYYNDKERAIGAIPMGEGVTLAWRSENGTAEIYFDQEPHRSLLVSDAWVENNFTINDQFSALVSNGVISEAYLLGDSANLAKAWGRHDGESWPLSTNWRRGPVYAQVESLYLGGKRKQFTVFSGVPGVMITSGFTTRMGFTFPTGFRVEPGDFGEVSGPVNLLVYCNGYALASREMTEFGCSSPEVWVIAAKDTTKWKNWLESRYRDEYEIEGLKKTVGYGPTCH